MVTVRFTYHGESIENVTISGHADYADKGEDLVCAAVSSIGVGSLNAIDSQCPESCDMQMREGYIKIDVINDSDNLQIILNTVRIQFKSIEYSNKQYIKVVKEEV